MNKLHPPSVRILKSLQTPEGGFLATPVDGAYPYVYVRDGVYIARALDEVGEHDRAERFYRFLFNVQNDDGSWEHRYLSDGTPATSRISETDGVGLVLSGLCAHLRATGDDTLLKDNWPAIKKAAAYIWSTFVDGLVSCVHSVHEYRPLEEGLEIWCNCACWRGLADLISAAGAVGDETMERKLASIAERLRSNILERFWDDKEKNFFKCIRFDGSRITYPDVTNVSPLYFGLTDYEGREGMLEQYDELLWDRELGGYWKFRRMEGVTDWHWYTGGFGPWVVHTLHMVYVFHKVERMDDACRCLRWVEKNASFDGMFPEHISSPENYSEWRRNEYELSPRILAGISSSKRLARDVHPWAIPLGWSHAEYVLTLAELKNSATT